MTATVLRPPTCTIDGLGVPLWGAFHWPLTTGAVAPRVIWELDPGAAEQVLAKRDVTIKFEDDTPILDVKAVVLGEVPSGSVYSRAVVLSDARWYWQFKNPVRAFNIRARTGDLRQINGADPTPNNLADAYKFKLYSIDDGEAPFTPRRLLEVLLGYLQDGRPWRIEGSPRATKVPNTLELTDRGDHGLDRALAVVGGMTVRCDPDGTIVVFNRLPGDEAAAVKRFVPYDLEEHGKLRWISLAASRAKACRVGYRRRHAIRFDAIEPATTVATDGPWMENTIQVTDPDLTAADGKAIYPGEYLERGAWFTAVAAKADAPALAGNFTLAKARAGFLGDNHARAYVQPLGTALPSAAWANRLGAFKRDFRRTYRINRRFVERVIPGTLEPYEADVLDSASGRRAPSRVFADYLQVPSRRQQSKDLEARTAWNIDSFPWATGVTQSQAGEKAYKDAPLVPELTKARNAHVRVLDPDVGLIRIEIESNPFDPAELILPMRVIDIPQFDAGKANRALAQARLAQCTVASADRKTVILSCCPAGTNDERALYVVEVEPRAALARLGAPVGDVVCGAPKQELFVGAALTVARFSWKDADSDKILAAFGATAGGVQAAAALRPVNEEELRDYAEGLAASYYASMLDHYEGVQRIAMEPALLPVGSIHTVTHSIEQDGRLLTTVSADASLPPPPPEALLRASTRAALFREIA